MSVATKEVTECLVKAAVDRDRVDQAFQSAVNKLTRSLKRRPGGRRKWIFDQAVFGAYKPHRPILEMMDLVIDDPDCKEEDVEPIADFFRSYMYARFAQKEIAAPSVREALRLETHADAEADKAQSDAAMDPTPGNLERVIETTSTHERASETLLSVCRRNIATRCMRLVPR